MKLPNKDTPVIVQCAGGVRSAFAAKTLEQLGYTDVTSMAAASASGRTRARLEGATEPATRPEEPLQASSAVARGWGGGADEAAGRQGAVAGRRGLGSPSGLYLAAAGVGTIGIVDMDVVDESNLQRQILHTLDRVGMRKVDSARVAIESLNPDVKVITHDVRLDANNIADIISGYDLVVDGADNFPVRYMLNDASVKLGIPVIHGSIFRFEGNVTVFDPRRGPTYRDLLPEPPPPEMAPSCAEAGVLGVLPGIVGCIQAIETIKYLLDLGDPLIGRYLAFDALDMTFREFKIRPDPANQITWENRDQIQVVELTDQCMPAPLEAPAAA
nr:ThiF family adenylyltransferase [Candidatus Microthrix sp.]